MTSQPADVARAGTEKWHSELLLPKMRGLPDFGFLGSLSLEHTRQEVKPGSKHRYDWDIPGDARWPLNLLVGGHLTLKRVTELSQKDHKDLPGIEWSLHSVLLLMSECKKERLIEGVFVKCSQFRCWHHTVLFLPRKKYVEGCNGRTLRLFARHSLRHVAPVRVSMYQNLSANVATSISFQNLPWRREVVTLPNERLDSQHDEGQFSECHLGAAEGNLGQRCFHNFWPCSKST